MRIPNLKLSRDELKYTRNLAFIALILNLIVEIFNRNSVIATLSSIAKQPHIFIYNALIIFMTLSITLLLRHRIVACIFLSTLWVAFGVTNNILLHFRTTPFTAVDLKLLNEAIPIMDKYITVTQMIGLGVLILIVLVVLIVAFIKLPKHKGKLNYLANGIATALIIAVTLIISSLGMHCNILAKNFGNIGDAFKDYGFAYCFANSLVNTGINKPSNYSTETISNIVEATEATPTTPPTQVPDKEPEKHPSVAEKEVESKTPNILFLQLESFFDPTHVEGMTFSEDPIPNFHALQEKYTSGFLNVPSVGAGTANTEFEIITGMNLDFFGPGEYPYKTILKQTTCESMAYNLKELGYGTHAIHNNTATFYGRHKVFANLGFDTFTSEEFMENITYNPLGWANDDVLIEEILKAMDSTKEKDYIYTISVQGHGKYPQDAESLLDGAISAGIDGDFSTGNSNTGTPKEEKKKSKKKKEKTETKDSVSTKVSTTPTPIADTPNSFTYQHQITIDGIEESRKYPFEYYVNQIHEMDIFLGKLVETLEAYEEDVVLVLYGDHLPSLGIVEESLDNRNMYQTEYIIWSSEGVIEEPQDRNLEAYQLSAYTLSLLNQSPGLLTKLHQKALSKEDSIVNSITSGEEVATLPILHDISSNELNESELTAEINEMMDLDVKDSDDETITYLQELELLQYDMLYGKQECFGNTNPYLATNLQFGIDPIVIESVSFEDGIGTVTGQHFTNTSKVFVDEEEMETTRVDSNTLTFEAMDLPTGSNVVVAQVNSEGTTVSQSAEYSYLSH